MRKRAVTSLKRNPVESGNAMASKFRSKYPVLFILAVILVLLFLLSLDRVTQPEKKEKKKAQNFSIADFGSDVMLFDEEKISADVKKTSKGTDVKLEERPEVQFSNTVVETVKWSLTTANKCDATFGNGWDEPTFSCEGPSSSMSCYRNKVTMSTYCKATNIVIDNTKIRVSPGREAIKDVAGRAENDEFCKYYKGAFVVPGASCKGSVGRKEDACHIADMTKFVGSEGPECTKPSKKTAVIITRYEYCNLYHTMTDWYNTYAMLATHGLLNTNEYEIVFFDGHSWGNLDSTWEVVFPPAFKYVKELPPNHCYAKAIFVPCGYAGGVSLRSTKVSCPNHQNVVEFGRYFIEKYGTKWRLSGVRNVKLVTLILRKDYLAHPRQLHGSSLRKTGRKLANSNEVVVALNKLENVEVTAIFLEDLTFKEQVELVAKTDVLIGVHGAGLTFAMLLPPEAIVIELVPRSHTNQPHFSAMARWSGHKHHSFSVKGSDQNLAVDPDALKSLVKRLL